MGRPSRPPTPAHTVRPRASCSPKASGAKFVAIATKSRLSFAERIINSFGNVVWCFRGASSDCPLRFVFIQPSPLAGAALAVVVDVARANVSLTSSATVVGAARVPAATANILLIDICFAFALANLPLGAVIVIAPDVDVDANNRARRRANDSSSSPPSSITTTSRGACGGGTPPPPSFRARA